MDFAPIPENAEAEGNPYKSKYIVVSPAEGQTVQSWLATEQFSPARSEDTEPRSSPTAGPMRSVRSDSLCISKATTNSCSTQSLPERGLRSYSRRLKVSTQDYLTNFRSPIHAAYIIKNKIGSGSWGVVHLAVERSSGYLRAIKKIPKKPSLDLARFRQEMTVLKGFDHPRIIRLYETYEDFAHLYMVMEYCKGGELFDRMVQEGPMPEPVAAWIMKQILSAVAYCHSRGIAHRDLKPENFLFMDRDIRSPLKLVDFGLAKRVSLDTIMTSAVGTIYYLAPELLTGSYTYKVDYWSAGAVMYTILYGSPPFQAETEAGVLRAIRDGNIDYAKAHVSAQAKDLIRGLCCRDPDRRLSAVNALKHPWFASQWPSPLLHLSTLAPIDDDMKGSLLPVSASSPCLQEEPGGDLIVTGDYCCDFAQLACGHSKKCARRVHSYDEEEPVTSPHLAGVLTHLRKLGLQNPQEASILAQRLVEKWRHYATLSPLKKALLSLAAQQLEHVRELGYIRALFDLLDTGGDGVLTPYEVLESMRALRATDNAEFDREVGGLIEFLDLDGNGQIEYSEFAAACLDVSTYGHPAAGKAIFRILDRDGDGRIGQGELKAALGWTNLDNDTTVCESDHQYVCQMLNDADKDKDGYIGSEDFEMLLNNEEGTSTRLYDASDLGPPTVYDEVLGRSRDQFDFSQVSRRSIQSADSSAPAGLGSEALAELRAMKIESSRQEMLRNQYLT